MVHKKFLIIRMLGNDMPNIHHKYQTLKNLEFTLKNESNFKNTDKIYLLNRIYDKTKREKIIQLLKKHKTKYIEIPFNMSYFKKLPKLNFTYNDLQMMDREEYIPKLLKHNLYLVNNNKARNYCINYGKKNNYEWTFALDSNSFFTEKDYYDVINNIDKKTQYIEIPQYRLDDANLKNNVLLTKKNLPYQREFEPQLAFKNTSKHKFNEKIPYGIVEKAELLNALGSKGEWNNWNSNEKYLNIKTRSFKNAHLERKSRIIRLSSHNSNNNINFNWDNRWYGLYRLITFINKEISYHKDILINKEISNNKILNNINLKNKYYEFNPTIFKYNGKLYSLIRKETDINNWNTSEFKYDLNLLNSKLEIISNNNCNFNINNNKFNSVIRKNLSKNKYCIEDIKYMKTLNNEIYCISNVLIQQIPSRINKVGILKININKNEIKLIKLLKIDNMNNNEKNWLYINHNNQEFIIYKLFPKLIIYKLDNKFNLSFFKDFNTFNKIKNTNIINNLHSYYNDLYLTSCMKPIQLDSSKYLIYCKKRCHNSKSFNDSMYEYYYCLLEIKKNWNLTFIDKCIHKGIKLYL